MFLTYTLTCKMEAAHPSEMLMNFYRTVWYYSTRDCTRATIYLTDVLSYVFLMFCRNLMRRYFRSCSQSRIEKKEGTGVHDIRILSPHENLPSDPYPSLLCTTDTIKRGSSDRKARPFETSVYCYVFICMLTNGFLNRQHTESRSRAIDCFSYWDFGG
jgi:hypothetical protein